MSKVAVLGCGPAGLLVAHAVVRYGWTPDIISVKQKSEIPGSQHLQGHIPGITPMYPDSAVEFIRIGTAEGYAQKVYGSPTHPTGWPNYTGTYKSWSVFKAYDKLWNTYRSLVRDSLVSVPVLPDILNEYHLVLSTLPMPTLCFREHNFESTPFWIKTLPTPEIDADREVVVYNGLPKDEWYRWSILGGKSSYEGSFTFPPEGSYVGKKAISNNCDCWPGLHRLGRWAQWKHGVLLHHAHSEALDIVLRTIGRRREAVQL
jgi:hypothetical protein